MYICTANLAAVSHYANLRFAVENKPIKMNLLRVAKMCLLAVAVALTGCEKGIVPEELRVPSLPSVSAVADGRAVTLTAIFKNDEDLASAREFGFYFGEDESSMERLAVTKKGGLEYSLIKENLEYSTTYHYKAWVGNGRDEVTSDLREVVTDEEPVGPDPPSPTYIAEFIYKPETDDFWGSLYIFCIVASFVAEFHVLREYTDIVIKQKEENLLLTKRLLKSQMNPHFVFNSLNILSGLIEEDPEKAEQFTVSLSRIYRYIINSLDKDIVPISEAMTFAKEYVSIMQTRYPSSIDFCDRRFFEVSLPIIQAS